MKKWNLDALYTSFESKEFQDDLVLIDELVEKANKFAVENFNENVDATKKLTEFMEINSALRTTFYKAIVFANLTVSTDATNSEARKYMSLLMQKSSKSTLATTKFSKWVPTLNLEQVFQESKELEEYRFFLERIVDGAKYVLSDEEEMVISRMQQTSSTMWGQLQGELTSTLKVEYRGEELPLSSVRNLSSDKDPQVRRDGYEAEMAAYPKIAQSVAYAINGVKAEVNTICDMRGFESALDQAVYNSRMERSTLDALISSMRDYLPHFHKYLKRNAKLLGHDGALPYYDIFAPVGESSKTFTETEAMEYIYKNFRTFSTELEDLARKAYDDEWIDFTPRMGKRGGAFCANIHPIKQSRVMTNFTGSFGNVITLAHELGHAYHGEQIFKEKIFNSSYTMPVAETASTFCETIVKNAALKDADDQEKIFILEQSLKGSTQVIVDILSRFIFEADVFDKRKTTPLNEQMLCDMMESAQKEAYGDSLDENYMMKYGWLNKSHYYRGSLSFYNFPYAFGLLFAKGIYAKFLEEGDSFVPKVDLLLQKTGQSTVEDVAALVGIDLSTKDFWNSSLEVIKQEIDLFLELTE